jgi:hypothetical protein
MPGQFAKNASTGRFDSQDVTPPINGKRHDKTDARRGVGSEAICLPAVSESDNLTVPWLERLLDTKSEAKEKISKREAEFLWGLAKTPEIYRMDPDYLRRFGPQGDGRGSRAGDYGFLCNSSRTAIELYYLLTNRNPDQRKISDYALSVHMGLLAKVAEYKKHQGMVRASRDDSKN